MSLIYLKKIRLPILNPFIFIGVFVFYLGYAFLGNSSFETGIQFVFATFPLLLFYAVIHYRINFNKNIYYCGLVLTILIYYISLSYFGFLELPYAKLLVDAYLSFELGFIGERQFGSVVLPMLHFVSAPMLLIIASNIVIDGHGNLKVSKKLLLAFIFGAIFLSGSRGILLFSFISCLSLFFFYASRINRIILSIFTAVLIIYIISNVDFGTAFDLNEQSNSIKFAHFLSFLEHLNLKLLLVGEGLASYYYTSGFNRFAAVTELMGLDFIRYFGVLTTILIIFVLMFPFRFVNRRLFIVSPFTKEKFPYFIAFSSYMLLAMTNPILLNSFGMLVVVWYWSNIY